MSDDVTIPRETAKEWAALLRSSTRDRLNPDWTPLADLLESPPADVSVTDAEHLSRAEARLDTISPVIAIDPAMGVNITEQIKTLFQVVAKSPRHGAAIVPCDCLVCASVHSIADIILREEEGAAMPSLRDEVLLAIDPTNGGGWEGEADAVLAVVRKHIAAMRGWDGGVASMDWSPDGPWIDRGDVLALLGGDVSDAREWLDSTAWATDDGVYAMRAALLAVLDLHREQIGLDDVLRYCYDCEDRWPCATVRAIDTALLGGDDE